MPAVSGGHFFDLGIGHAGNLRAEVARLRFVHEEFIKGQAPVRLAGLGEIADGILRAEAAEEVFAFGIGEVIDFLGLPGTEIFEIGFEAAKRNGDLGRENGGIAGEIESLSGENAGGLVIAVVFTDERAGKKGEDDFGAGEANEADEIFESAAVAPVGEGLQDVLRGGVLAAEKPDMSDAEGSAGATRFDFANVAEGGGLLGADFVGSAAAAGAVGDGDALAFVNGAREVGSGGAFVIGMSDDEENIGFEARVGFGQGSGELRLLSGEQDWRSKSREQSDKAGDARESLHLRDASS